MAGFMKVNNSIKEISSIFCKVNNEIKEVASVWEKKNGQVKQIWSGAVEIPPGTIIPFYGSINDIPEGWVVCDGTNGAPNLVNKFVRGGTNIGATGGSTTHSHTLSSYSHSHNVSSSSHRHAFDTRYLGTLRYRSSDSVYTNYNGSHTHSATSSSHNHGGTNSASNIPPNCALLFIMKL